MIKPRDGSDCSSIEQQRVSLLDPRSLVGSGEIVKIGRQRGGIIHPLTQQFTPVDNIDGQAIGFVFVGKIAPERIIRSQSSQAFEGQCYEAPGLECIVIVSPIINMDLYPGA